MTEKEKIKQRLIEYYRMKPNNVAHKNTIKKIKEILTEYLKKGE